MKSTITKSALACLVLKAGQQILHDMDSIVMDDTTADVARFAAEQYACRLGSPLIAAYVLDKAIGYAEEIALPKFLRGALPVAVSTLGAGAIMHYAGRYMNIEQSANFIEATKILIGNYTDTLAKLTTLNPEANAGYLTLAALILKSGARWVKNIAESIGEYAENKKLKKQKLEEIA